jgi:hypothetical protein
MITKKQIKEGLDKAYKEAGENAYFGNGFELGVEFTLNQFESNAVIEQSEQLKEEIFTLANKLAIVGEGDAAVKMHRIYNSL